MAYWLHSLRLWNDSQEKRYFVFTYALQTNYRSSLDSWK